MHYLTERIATAQACAAAAAGDIRIKEFLEALRVFAIPSDGTPKGVFINCHNRFWFHTLTDGDIASIETSSSAELPNLITRWIQEAIRDGLLSLSNPPDPTYQRRSSASAAASPVGLVTTFVYDANGNFVRSYSG